MDLSHKDGRVVSAMSSSVGTRYDDFTGGPVEAKDRRFVMRALRDWVVLSRNHPMPSINRLDPGKFDMAWEKSFILRLSDRADTAAFEYRGRTLQQPDRDIIVGRGLNPSPDRSLLDYATRALDLVVERGAPVITSGTDPWGKGKILKFRAILLPFSDGRDTLGYVVGGISHIIAAAPRDAAPPQIHYQIFDRSTSRLEPALLPD